jgi:excisionase family DNA binding protein
MNEEHTDWMTLAEVADAYGIPTQTLYWYRQRSIGPPSYRAGRRVRYRRSEVEAWLAAGSDQPAAC